jgi:ATP/maltotriose-dependent transcriptional regulator MalT
LGPYLLESYWTSLDPLLRSLLTATSIFHIFDRSDAEAVMPGQDLEAAWTELAALPFVSHLPRVESLLIYQPLFRTFLSDRLSRELSSAEVRHLHRAAASHFLDDKSMPPAALHHARLAGDSALLIRTTGSMVEFAFSRGEYPLLRDVMNQLSPTTRWEDATLAVYQGRLYEHDLDLTNALKWYRRAQELFEQQGPAFWRIGIVNDIGGILRKTGKLDEALALYDEALARSAADTPSSERAGLIVNRANVFLQRGSLEQAEEGFLAARDIFELNCNAGGISRSYQGLAHVAHARENDQAEFRFFAKALHWLRRSDNASGLPHVVTFFGERLIIRGKYALVQCNVEL